MSWVDLDWVRSQGLFKSSQGRWAILQLLCSQARRKLLEELPPKLFTKPWDRAIDALCINNLLTTRQSVSETWSEISVSFEHCRREDGLEDLRDLLGVEAHERLSRGQALRQPVSLVVVSMVAKLIGQLNGYSSGQSRSFVDLKLWVKVHYTTTQLIISFQQKFFSDLMNNPVQRALRQNMCFQKFKI